jgi:hypothetical protein
MTVTLRHLTYHTRQHITTLPDHRTIRPRLKSRIPHSGTPRHHCRTLNLHIRTQRQRLNSNASSRLAIHQHPHQHPPHLISSQNAKQNGCKQTNRLGLPKRRLIDFIHSRKVLHISQEDIHLDDILQTRPACFQDSGEIMQDLLLRCLSFIVSSF